MKRIKLTVTFLVLVFLASNSFAAGVPKKYPKDLKDKTIDATLYVHYKNGEKKMARGLYAATYAPKKSKTSLTVDSRPLIVKAFEENKSKFSQRINLDTKENGFPNINLINLDLKKKEIRQGKLDYDFSEIADKIKTPYLLDVKITGHFFNVGLFFISSINIYVEVTLYDVKKKEVLWRRLNWGNSKPKILDLLLKTPPETSFTEASNKLIERFVTDINK